MMRLFAATETVSMHATGILQNTASASTALLVNVAYEEDGPRDSGNRWNQFKKEFDSQLDSSEREMHQIQFHKLREELLIAALGMVEQDPGEQEADIPKLDSSGKWQLSTMADPGLQLLDFGSDLDLSSPVPCPSHQATASSPRPSPTQRHGILHSSRFERISEGELDTVLEAIEEESEHSREGSRSPVAMAANK